MRCDPDMMKTLQNLAELVTHRFFPITPMTCPSALLFLTELAPYSHLTTALMASPLAPDGS